LGTRFRRALEGEPCGQSKKGLIHRGHQTDKKERKAAQVNLRRFSLSKNPAAHQAAAGFRSQTERETAKIREDARWFHFHLSSFLRFMAANLSFTHVLRITHSVFFFGVGKDPFNGFFAPCI
jgi:hypothetical protein